MNKKLRAAAGLIVLALILSTFISLQTKECNINIIAGKKTSVSIDSFFKRLVLCNDSEELSINGSYGTRCQIDSKKNIFFFAEKKGNYTLQANILGVIPYRQVNVNVLDNEILYAGGELVGIDINTKGIIAVGFEDITSRDGSVSSPAKNAGIRIGDVICAVNGEEVDSAEEFSALLAKYVRQEECALLVAREDVKLQIKVKPTENQRGIRQIGLWVRDRIMGLGTLTFISPEQNLYGALGHAVTDSTSGVTIPIKTGKLVGAEVVSLVRGTENKPGEIRGVLNDRRAVYGNVLINNDFGICGRLDGNVNLEKKEGYPIALQKEVREGAASILTTLDDDGIKEYEIVIEKTFAQDYPDSKSMLIRVTDPILLDKTGGIIQGMSGSPIIQDGKIVGAITHVLVNDSTRGYGIFIEWMLNNLNSCQ